MTRAAQVARLRRALVHPAGWSRVWAGLRKPLGLAGVAALVLAIVCGLAGVDTRLGEATIGGVLYLLAFVLIAVSAAREAGASRIGLAALSIGGAVVVARAVLVGVDSGGTEYVAGFTIAFWVICANAGGLPQEEFSQRYHSPPGWFRPRPLVPSTPGSPWPVAGPMAEVGLDQPTPGLYGTTDLPARSEGTDGT